MMSEIDKEAAVIEAGSSAMVEGEEYYNAEGGEWLERLDTGQLCRICANPNEYLIPIFEGEGLEHELALKIKKHLPIEVSETDTLPRQVCYQCASTLIAWHDLVICCVEADKKLQEFQVEEHQDGETVEAFEAQSCDSDTAEDVVENKEHISDGKETNKITKPSTKGTSHVAKEKKSKLKSLVESSCLEKSTEFAESVLQEEKASESAKPNEDASQESGERSRCCSENPVKALQQCLEAPSTKDLSLKKSKYDKCLYEPHDDLSAKDIFGLPSIKKTYNENSASLWLKDHTYVIDVDAELQNAEVQQCEYCEQEFASLSVLNYHIKCKHNQQLQHSCSFCGTSFSSRNKLKVHRNVCSSELHPHLCHTCGKTFTSLNKLKCHEKRVHEDSGNLDAKIKQHICEICGLSFLLSRYLRKHMLKHGEKNFVCETCGKRFETNYKLKLHQECHSEQRPYPCKICGSAYKRHRNLLSHEQEVHGIFSLGPGKEKESLSFACDFCKKEFTTPKRLTAHLRTHTGERPYSCEQCGHTFRIYSSLLFHRRVVHEGRKVYGNKGMFPCEVCGKVFSTKQYQETHLRIHKGEKPYVCKVCGRAFTQRTSLVNHMALHSDLRPYPCTHCNKAFRRRETLMIHIRTHTGEKPHVCDICGRGFAQRTDMRKHRYKIHNMIMPRKNE